MVISHISNKIIIGEESSFGTEASAYDKNFGFIQSFSYTENESIEQIGTIGGGHTHNRNEPGIYHISGTLVTKVTKSTLPIVLTAFLGGYSDDGVDYTITSSTTVKSYSVKAQHSDDDIAKITGIVFTNLSIDASKDGTLEVSMDYIGKKLELVTESITPIIPTDSLYSWLDIFGTYNSLNLIGNSFSIELDWNIDPNDGRGLESVTAGERRLIQRVIKNNLNVSGNFDALIQDTEFFGYNDEITESSFVLTLSRGTDNQHTFTLSNAVLDNKSVEKTAEAGLSNMTADVLAFDITVTGNL